MDPQIRTRIESDIRKNRVVLFMKGTPALPQCGFSHQAVQILRAHEVTFEGIDVLEDLELREGIKQWSGWPTIPQLYVDGEFIGGCDIMMEMHESGDLATLLDPSG